jgi:hypothetical protein
MTVPVGFAGSAAAVVGQEVAHGRKANPSPSANMRACWQILEALSDHIRALPETDAGAHVLWKASRVLHGSDRYLPGREQLAVLHSVPNVLHAERTSDGGLTGGTRPPVLFAALVAAAVDDVGAHVESRVTDADKRARVAEKKVKKLEERTVDRSEVDQVREELDAWRARYAELRDQNRELREQVRLASAEPAIVAGG